MDKADRPVKEIEFIFANEVKKDFRKIDKIQCALEREDLSHLLKENNSFISNVCLEDKYKLRFKNVNKVRANKYIYLISMGNTHIESHCLPEIYYFIVDRNLYGEAYFIGQILLYGDFLIN
jgi:hypothetical protein